MSVIFSASVQAQTYTGPRISERQIYENPDDHDLNLNYAKQQVIRGDMISAAAALERLLYENPNWHSARLFYAAILYRLDDQKAALRELQLLEDKNLNAQQALTYAQYKDDFKVPPKRSALLATSNGGVIYGTRDPITGRLSVGLRIDNNAGNALADSAFGFEDRGDISTVVQGRFRARTPISADRNTTARAEISGQIRNHETFSTADYASLNASAGVSTLAGEGRISFDVDARRLSISGENYLTQLGPRITVSRPISETLRVTASGSIYDQNYDNLSNAPLENFRDGVKGGVQIGILRRSGRVNRISAAVGYDVKNADIDAFRYDGLRAAAGFKQQWDERHTFNGYISVRQLNFKGRLASDGPGSDRKETRINARLATGIGFPEIIDDGLSAAKAAEIELGINYNYRDSNVASINYENIGVDVRLILDF